jgi:CRP/FNR family transcriptional regulator
MGTFEQFIAKYPSKTFDKGQTILLKDVVPQAVYVIESGLVKTYTITAAGDERLVSIDSVGEDLPIGYAFGLIDRSQYFHEAYSRCVVRLVPRDAYVTHLRNNIESMYRRHVRLIILLLATFSRVNALEQSRAGDKIASTLLYMADQIGVRLHPSKSRLRLPITQQEIADSLGLTRETAGIELKKLELKNILTHSRKNYVLYMERLRKYLDDINK